MTTNCLHVRIKATRDQLIKEGIDYGDAGMEELEQVIAFPVERKRKTGNGRNALLLNHPTNSNFSFWIYEDMTEPIL